MYRQRIVRVTLMTIPIDDLTRKEGVSKCDLFCGHTLILEGVIPEGAYVYYPECRELEEHKHD